MHNHTKHKRHCKPCQVGEPCGACTALRKAETRPTSRASKMLKVNCRVDNVQRPHYSSRDTNKTSRCMPCCKTANQEPVNFPYETLAACAVRLLTIPVQPHNARSTAATHLAPHHQQPAQHARHTSVEQAAGSNRRTTFFATSFGKAQSRAQGV